MKRPLRSPERPLRFVQGRHEIVTFGVGGPGHERCDPLAVGTHGFDGGTEFGRRRHVHGSLLSSPGVDRTAPPLVAARDAVTALEGYHSRQVEVAVRLNTNESPFGPPDGWFEALWAELAEVRWNRYPDRQAVRLRTELAALHDVGAANVFVANGSNEVIQTLLLAYAGPGRTVATFEPTYQLHGHISRVTGATVVSGVRGDDFRLDPDEARRVIAEHDPAVVFLCSPNNPTGVVEDPAVLDAVVEASSGLVVVDEAYAQFAGWSALGHVSDDARVVVVRTFSKTWSMAGARLGYLVGPSWVVDQLDKVVLPYHLDAAKQVVGRLALRYVDEMERRVAEIVAERGRVSARLADLGAHVVPSGANFVLFRPLGVEAAVVWERLVDDGVLVRDCSSWPGLTGCLRVTIGRVDENDRFLAALAQILADPTPRST